MDAERENKLVLIAARWEAICDILERKKVSDFLLSFPEVSQVADLVAASQQGDSADGEKRCEFGVISGKYLAVICPQCNRRLSPGLLGGLE